MWWGLKQALVDPKLYMFIGLIMSLITAESFSNFFPSIVGTLGYNSTNTLLLTSPPYFFAFFVSLAVSFHASRAHERGYHIAVPMAFALLGNLMVGVPFVKPFFDVIALTSRAAAGNVCPIYWRSLFFHVPHDSRLLCTIQPMRKLDKRFSTASPRQTCRGSCDLQLYGRGCGALLHVLHVSR